jgi:hypothetical protein
MALSHAFSAESILRCNARNPAMAKPFAAALAILVVGITVFTAYRSRRDGGISAERGYRNCLFPPHDLPCCPTLMGSSPRLSPPCRDARTEPSNHRKLSWPESAVVIAALLLFTARIDFAHPAISKGWWTLLISIKFYAAVSLWVFFIVRLARVRIRRNLPPLDSAQIFQPGCERF